MVGMASSPSAGNQIGRNEVLWNSVVGTNTVEGEDVGRSEKRSDTTLAGSRCVGDQLHDTNCPRVVGREMGTGTVVDTRGDLEC